MEDKIYDCTVIGGGISGVSFAYYLGKAGKKTLIVDEKQAPGGQIQTGYSSVQPDYWFEMGAHTCYNSYVNLLSIVDEAGLRELVQPLMRHGYTVYSQDKIKSIASEISFLPMIPALFKYAKADRTGKTVKDFFCPLTGRRNYDHIFSHAFNAVICQPADNYPVEIFLKKRPFRDKTFPRKFTFKQGISSLINAILSKCRIEHLQSAEITEITKENDIYVCKTADNRFFKAKNISLAVNPQMASQLSVKIEEDVSKLLSTIPSCNSESLNVVVLREKLKMKKMAGIISLSDDFLSAVSRDLVRDEKFRSFTFHFEKDKLKLSEKVNLICKALNINVTDIAEQTETKHVLPALRTDSLGIEEKLDRLLKGKSVYITGNYFQGLSIEDCVMRSKREAERFLENDKQLRKNDATY